MTDVTIHVASSEWCVHFVITLTQIPIGPWLLFNSSDEVKAKVFRGGTLVPSKLSGMKSTSADGGSAASTCT